MERKFLKDELGLSDDVITKVLKANGEDIERVEAKATASNTERDNLQTQLNERDQQLKDLKKHQHLSWLQPKYLFFFWKQIPFFLQ